MCVSGVKCDSSGFALPVDPSDVSLPVDLLSLLKWKQSPERIVETLTRMMKLKGEETVKFLQDVLDSLFSMFSTEDGNSTQHSGLVFQVLVSGESVVLALSLAYSTRLLGHEL